MNEAIKERKVNAPRGLDGSTQGSGRLSTLQPSLEAVPEFLAYLETFRSKSTPEDWKLYISSAREIREWRYFLSQDPYTRWGLLKPKGYAGDGRVIDFACQHPSVHEDLRSTGEVGRAIYQHTAGGELSQSARSRLEYFTQHIESWCQRHGPGPHLASYGCGHGRELEGLSLETLRSVQTFHAVDSDPACLELIQKNSGVLQVEPVYKDVFRFHPPGRSLDLVYSVGLFDHLDEAKSRFLLQKMFATLRPGGRLLLSNLDPMARNIAYCEAAMDWWRVPKSKSQLFGLADHLPDARPEDVIKVKEHGCFNTLCIDKAD